MKGVQSVFMTSVQVMNHGYINMILSQSRIWVFPGEAAPMKFKRSRSVGKQMVASFFS